MMQPTDKVSSSDTVCNSVKSRRGDGVTGLPVTLAYGIFSEMRGAKDGEQSGEGTDKVVRNK